MKAKKTLTVLTVAALGASSLMGFAGCGHEHDYVWTEDPLATCTTDGVEKGKCKICGEETERTVPASDDRHAYGDWAIAEPTADAAGKAVKQCTLNAAHKLEVTLPALNGEGGGTAYSVTEKRAPTLIEEGEKEYVYAHSAGNITFSVATPAIGIHSVADAVSVGISRRAYVRSGAGEVGSDYIMEGSSLETNEVTYEFGDKYFHYQDGSEYREAWYAYDANDEIYGVIEDSMGERMDAAASEESFDGAPVVLQTMTIRENGLENFLESMYDLASLDDNGDLKEEIVAPVEAGEATVYKFSFGTYDVSNDYFFVVSVSFTLGDDYIIDSLTAQALGYMSYDGGFEENNGKYTVINPDADHYEDYVSFTQKAKKPDDVIPENPITLEGKLFESFKLSYGGKELANGAVLEMTAGGDGAVVVEVAEMLPDTATDVFDPVMVYMDVNGKLFDLSSYEMLSQQGVLTMAFYGLDWETFKPTITIQSQKVGDSVLVVKTAHVEKRFTIRVAPAAPTQLLTSYNGYFEATDSYDWVDGTAANIYLGQSVLFTAKIDEYIAAYTDGSFTAAVAGTGASVTEGKGGIWTFEATAAGEYTVTMTSEADTNVTCTLTVTVSEVPDLTEILTGTYENRRGGETVVFDTVAKTITVTDKNENVTTLNYTFENNVLATSGSDVYSVRFNANYKLVLVVKGVGNIENKNVLSRPKGNTPEAKISDTVWTCKVDDGYGGYNTYTLTFSEDGTTGVLNKNVGMNNYFAFTLAEDPATSGKYIFTFSEDAAHAADNTSGMNAYFQDLNFEGYRVPNADNGSYVIFGDGETLVITVAIVSSQSGELKSTQTLTFTQQ